MNIKKKQVLLIWYDSFELIVTKIGRAFKLPKELIKIEMNHDEVDGDNYEDKKDE